MPTINDYLDTITPEQRMHFEHLRRLVYTIAPDAVESISYGMPTFKYTNQPLLYFGAFKNHMSLFPAPGPAEKFKEKLKDYKVSKGTIQFTHDHPLPDTLIKEIISSRLSDITNA